MNDIVLKSRYFRLWVGKLCFVICFCKFVVWERLFFFYMVEEGLMKSDVLVYVEIYKYVNYMK